MPWTSISKQNTLQYLLFGNKNPYYVNTYYMKILFITTFINTLLVTELITYGDNGGTLA